VLEWLKDATANIPVNPAHVAAAFVVLPAIVLFSNLPYNDRHRFFVAHDYVDNINASVESGGMVLTTDWQAYSPSLYVREIEGQRRDLVFIDTNLLRRTWYFSYMQKAYPDTVARSGSKVSAFWEDLRAWARDPAAYERSQTLNQRINARFQEMVLSIMTEQLKTGRPLYVTLDLADPNGGKEPGLVRGLLEKYDLVPQGLVFRLVEKGSTAVLSPPPINTRGLGDGTMKYDDDDVVKRSVIPTYVSMLSNNGLYLQSKGMNDRAVPYFQQALALDPAFESAKNGLAASQAAIAK
jgi:hypothetical protein